MNEVNEITFERVNVRVSNIIKDWYVDLSKKTGMSMSALMAFALNEFKDQKTSVEAMNTMHKMYTETLSMNEDEKKAMFDFMLNNSAK